ncbi:MAG: type II toxin-antitoxin system RelE/ParE family toxin [Patescibacteria group bacterium]|nr:type II toxin-antitoxin system RelE/ParE family toxin [Patescibacteria group bacterium]
MSWRIRVAKRVSKEVKRIPKKDAKRLLSVLEELAENPYQGDIEKIKDEDNVWRRRVGSYRVLYEVVPKRKFLNVFQISRRTTTTYHKRA